MSYAPCTCLPGNEKETNHAFANAGLDAIAYILYLEAWLQNDEAISDIDDDLLQRLYEKWVTQWLPSRSEPHCGDCTSVAGSCTRCAVENLYDDAARIIKASNDKLTGCADHEAKGKDCPACASRLIVKLEELRKLAILTHNCCEDRWYSCPKAVDGCADERQGDECNCGAEKHNAEVERVFAEALEVPNVQI